MLNLNCCCPVTMLRQSVPSAVLLNWKKRSTTWRRFPKPTIVPCKAPVRRLPLPAAAEDAAATNIEQKTFCPRIRCSKQSNKGKITFCPRVRCSKQSNKKITKGKQPSAAGYDTVGKITKKATFCHRVRCSRQRYRAGLPCFAEEV